MLRHPTYEFQGLLRLTRIGENIDLDFDYAPGEIPLVQPSTYLPGGLRRRELVSLAANGLLDKDDPYVIGMRDRVDSGASSGHPCANIIVNWP